MSPLPPIPRRSTLPDEQEKKGHLNVWTVLKDMIGSGDMLSLPLPSEMHLPATELQKQVEEFEYTELLDKAATHPAGSLDRLILVAVFSATSFATCKRTDRALNPQLGETYCLDYPEKGWRYLAQLVQRKPLPYIAVSVRGRGWRVTSDSQPQVAFMGTYLDLDMNFAFELVFDDGDTFNWHKGKVQINGLLVGKLALTHLGSWEVTHPASGSSAHVEMLKPPSVLSFSRKAAAKPHEVKGHFVVGGKPVKGLSLHGQWDGALYVARPDGTHQMAWQANALPPNSRWAFSQMLIHANELTPGLLKRLPICDSRLRPDLRALEEGRYAEATRELRQLEAHASKVADRLEKENGAGMWCWFAPVAADNGRAPRKGQVRFRYRGGFWEAFDAGTGFPNAPDIFGLGTIEARSESPVKAT